MVRVLVILLQGELKFSPKVYLQNIQTFNLNSNGDWELKDKSMECKCMGKLFESEDDAFRSVRNFIAATLAIRKIKFKGEILGLRFSSDENAFKKCRFFVREDDMEITHEYIEYKLVKQRAPRAPRLQKKTG